MTRYFYIYGKANQPARFYTVAEICTKVELLLVKKLMRVKPPHYPYVNLTSKVNGISINPDGRILKIENEQVENDPLLRLHNFKILQDG